MIYIYNFLEISFNISFPKTPDNPDMYCLVSPTKKKSLRSCQCFNNDEIHEKVLQLCKEINIF